MLKKLIRTIIIGCAIGAIVALIFLGKGISEILFSVILGLSVGLAYYFIEKDVSKDQKYSEFLTKNLLWGILCGGIFGPISGLQLYIPFLKGIFLGIIVNLMFLIPVNTTIFISRGRHYLFRRIVIMTVGAISVFILSYVVVLILAQDFKQFF